MTPRQTAADQLERILYVIPRAAREDGVAIFELERGLGVPWSRIREDLTAFIERVYYHPAGGGDEIDFWFDSERVFVRSTGPFLRPMKLTPREALAAELGLRLRMLDTEDEAERARLADLIGRLDRELATRPASDMLGQYGLEGGEKAIDGIRGLLMDASTALCRCRIRYLGSRDDEPRERTLDPYCVGAQAGRWYAIGSLDGDPETKVIRIDRVLEAEATGERYTIPEDFDETAYLDGGHIYRSDDETRVRVRYANSVARWVRERGDVEELASGDVIVELGVSDPGWVVRHVLQYGPDAEILRPPAIRGLAADTARRVAELHA